MERDCALIQWLLEHVAQKRTVAPTTVPNCKRYTQEQLNYHIGLCQQAGYLDADIVSGAEERFPRYGVRRLTWAGHEALDAFRAG